MPSVKLHPPNPLPPKTLTQQQYDIWKTELQAWLSGDDVLSLFLPDRKYPNWASEEQDPHQINDLNTTDADIPNNSTQQQQDDLLTKRRRRVHTFLSGSLSVSRKITT